MHAAIRPFFFALLLLSALLVTARGAAADEWNDSFTEPHPYKLLRGIAVRGGPGNDTSRLGALSEGDVIQVSEIINGWHKFDFQGQDGWIFKRYLRPMAAGEPGSEAAAPKKDDAAAKDAVAAALNELEEQVAETPPAEEPLVRPESEVSTEETPEGSPVVEEQPSPPAQENPEIATPEQDEPPQTAAEEDDISASAKTAPQPEPEERKRVARTPTESITPDDCPRFTSLHIKPDSNEVVFEGNLRADKKACFRLLTLKDWILEITLRSEPDQARFDVFTPQEGRLAQAMSAWAQALKISGDKQIVLYNTPASGKEANTRYSLHVLVRQP